MPIPPSSLVDPLIHSHIHSTNKYRALNGSGTGGGTGITMVEEDKHNVYSYRVHCLVELNK